MSLGGLRYTRGREDEVSTATEGQTGPVVNAVENATSLKPQKGTLSLVEPGGCELWELGDGRSAERGREQHTSNALGGSGNTSN